MCTGLEPIALAMMAGGSAASAMGAKMNADTQNNAIVEQNRQNQMAADRANQAAEQERMQQRAYEDQQVAEVAEALTKANPAKALVRVRQEAKTGPVASDGGGYNATPKAPVKNRAIEADARKTGAKDAKRTDRMIEALAMLTAMGTDMSATNDTIQQSGSDISTLGGFRRGSLGVNQMETSIPAATVTPGDSMLGDLLMLSGQAGAGFGGQRVTPDAMSSIASIFKPKVGQPLAGTNYLAGMR